MITTAILCTLLLIVIVAAIKKHAAARASKNRASRMPLFELDATECTLILQAYKQHVQYTPLLCPALNDLAIRPSTSADTCEVLYGIKRKINENLEPLTLMHLFPELEYTQKTAIMLRVEWINLLMTHNNHPWKLKQKGKTVEIIENDLSP